MVHDLREGRGRIMSRMSLPSVTIAAVALGWLPLPCAAGVVTDGSVGPARSLAGPNFAIGADLGRQIGGNLFHSFSRFNLATGESATFSGPGSVANILARVTGGSASSIDGTVRS